MNTPPTSLQPYHELDRGSPYSAKSPDPDRFIAATVGGQPLKRIMATLREAGDPRVNLFACINAAKHLARFSWLTIDQRPSEKVAIYSPGPRALGEIADERPPELAAEPVVQPTGQTYTTPQIVAALVAAGLDDTAVAAVGRFLREPPPEPAEPEDEPTADTDGPPIDDTDEIPE